MKPDNNWKRKWERMFPVSCTMHLSCTAPLPQFSRHTDLHRNSSFPAQLWGQGSSAACSPLTCALPSQNHCSGVQAFISKTKMRVGIQPGPIKGRVQKPPLHNCLWEVSTPAQTTGFMLCWEHTTRGGCSNTLMGLIHTDTKFFTNSAKITFLYLLHLCLGLVGSSHGEGWDLKHCKDLEWKATVNLVIVNYSYHAIVTAFLSCKLRSPV